MDEVGHVHHLLQPGLYHIHLACHLGESWQTSLLEEGFFVRWLADSDEGAEPLEQDLRSTKILLYASDQGELLALLTYLYGLGIPLRSVAYAGSPDL